MDQLDPDFAALLKVSQGAPKSPEKYDPTEGMSTFDKVLAGTGQGMMDLWRHAGNLVGAYSKQDLEDAKSLDAPLLNTGAGRAGQFIGQTAAMLPLGMGAGAALGKLGITAAARPVLANAVQGAAQGGVMADPGQKLAGAGLGAAFGAAIPAAGAVGSTLARGFSRTPAAQTLLNELPPGTLTPGQLNPRGAINRMEQALEGTLGMGDTVQNARENAMGEYTRAMVQRSLPEGVHLPADKTSMGDMIQFGKDSFENAYDVAKGYPAGAKIINVTGPDIPLEDAFKGLASRARPGITGAEQGKIARNIQDLLQQTVKDGKSRGGLQSDDLIAFRSTLRGLRDGEALTDNASRARASIYGDAADKVTQAIESQIPSDAASALQSADRQFKAFAVIRNAVAAAKDNPNGPTPFQISNAIAQATTRNSYAAGGGVNRDLSQAAAETFQQNVPRTGLAGAGRLAIPAIAAKFGAPLAFAHPLAAGLGAAGLVGTGALTLSRVGRMAAAGQLPLQRALAARISQESAVAPPWLTQGARYLPPAASGAALSLLSPRLERSDTTP